VNKTAHQEGEVGFLHCLNFEGKDMFLTGSQGENSLKLWNKQDSSDVDYYVPLS
jgi:hypothetical protein